MLNHIKSYKNHYFLFKSVEYNTLIIHLIYYFLKILNYAYDIVSNSNKI